MTKYFNSVDAVRNYAECYPASNFRVEHSLQTCQCNGVRIGYDVTDRQDSEILETLVVCPACANNPKKQQ